MIRYIRSGNARSNPKVDSPPLGGDGGWRGSHGSEAQIPGTFRPAGTLTVRVVVVGGGLSKDRLEYDTTSNSPLN